MLLGAHVSSAGGHYKAFGYAEAWDCTAMQIFTKAPSNWRAKPISEEDAAKFREAAQASGVKVTVAHDSYLINLASPNPDILNKSLAAMREELERCEQLGVPYLVTHMGSHMGEGDDAGLAKLAQSIDHVHDQLPGFKAKILLESTAGQGTNLGYRFEHLAYVIGHVKEPERLGVCLDTCHLFVAGYDIRTAPAYRKTMKAFDQIVGLNRVQCWHLNDAKMELGSRRDRHEHIGKGEIGKEAFRLILNDRRFANVPKIIETPDTDTEGLKDLKVLRALVKK